MEDAGERSEQPTPRKREEARERGQVARSLDLSTAVILLAALLALRVSGASMWEGLSGVTHGVFEHLHDTTISPDSFPRLLGDLFLRMGLLLLPFIATVVVVAFLINVVQVGLVVSPEPLTPDLSKLDPIKGFQRLFSMRSVIKTGISIAKILIVGAVVYFAVQEEIASLNSLIDMHVSDILLYSVHLSFDVGIRMCIVLLILAILDYAYQRYQMTQDLMMTKQEVKEELKRMEGDPRIRERRRQIQRQLAQQRMMQKVPKASVVITNPTHFAVAIEYHRGMPAPKVVAKGLDLMALRIQEVARENGVPIFQQPPLARQLYKMVEIDEYIPGELFAAVAEVLAFVFQTNRKAFEEAGETA